MSSSGKYCLGSCICSLKSRAPRAVAQMPGSHPGMQSAPSYAFFPPQSASVQEVAPLPNGDSHRTRGSRDMGHPPPSEPVPTMPGLLSPQPAQPVADQTPLLPKASDSYSCTLPMPRKASTETRLATLGKYLTSPSIAASPTLGSPPTLPHS